MQQGIRVFICKMEMRGYIVRKKKCIQDPGMIEKFDLLRFISCALCVNDAFVFLFFFCRSHISVHFLYLREIRLYNFRSSKKYNLMGALHFLEESREIFSTIHIRSETRTIFRIHIQKVTIYCSK